MPISYSPYELVNLAKKKAGYEVPEKPVMKKAETKKADTPKSPSPKGMKKSSKSPGRGKSPAMKKSPAKK